MCGQARLEDEIAIGGNTIRVWGGGIYETETFYRTADRLGLIILQGGSFFGSCKLQVMPRLCRHDCHASFPADPTFNQHEDPEAPANVAYMEFQDLVAREIAYQARRLSGHPSLCIYSGK